MKRGINDYSLAHLTLILLLHYLVKCRSRSFEFDVYNNEFILCRGYRMPGTPHAGSENHCETTNSLKICYIFNINLGYFLLKLVHI